jgi:tetratricopeptide (TPR) repeat protein
MRIRNTLLVLTFCVGSFASLTSANADLILLGGSSKPSSEQDLKAATAALASGNIELCRQELSAYCTLRDDVPNPEVLLASLLLDAKQLPAAKQVLTDLLRDTSAAFESHLALSRIAALEQRWADAWAHCRVAEMESMPSTWSSDYSQSVQLSHRMLKSEIAIARRDWNAALPIIEELILVDKENPVLLRQFARVNFLANRDIQLTAKALQDAQALDDRDELPFQVRLALLHLERGEKSLAENKFQEALRVEPREKSYAKIAYAEWLINENRPADATRILLEIGEGENIPARRDLLLGMAHRMQQQFPQAEKLFTRLHQSDTTNLTYSNQLALVLIESQDEGKRARALQIASANFGRIKNESTVSTLAWIEFRLGNIKTAAELFVKLASQSQLSPDSAYYFSEILRSSGREQEADRLNALASSAPGPRFTKSP